MPNKLPVVHNYGGPVVLLIIAVVAIVAIAFWQNRRRAAVAGGALAAAKGYGKSFWNWLTHTRPRQTFIAVSALHLIGLFTLNEVWAYWYTQPGLMLSTFVIVPLATYVKSLGHASKHP